MSEIMATFVVVGGGIAGVSCAEQLAYMSQEPVCLVTASTLIKAVTHVSRLTRTLEEFQVEEKEAGSLQELHRSLNIIHDKVQAMNAEEKFVTTVSGERVRYQKMCICTGATPKLIAENHPHVVGIRDTDSVKAFSERIALSKRVVVVGNGGIATEVIYETRGVEIIWVVKDRSISSTFVDPGASEFFLAKFRSEDKPQSPTVTKRAKYTASSASSGAALGPDWHSGYSLQGSSHKDLRIEYETEVAELLDKDEDGSSEWPVYAKLTSGKVYGCDLVVSATGVVPNTAAFVKKGTTADHTSADAAVLTTGTDGGILVNDKMETSIANVFAAGDVCTAEWTPAPHWFQMRLWTQARQMGMYAAKSMCASFSGEPITPDFCFEMFSHVTRFFGMKVVLLGLFNGQRLGLGYEILLRTTKGMEYIKAVMKDHKMQGAILIGDTDLEETFENLILNQMDLEPYGEDLLDPNIDIEDYFD